MDIETIKPEELDFNSAVQLGLVEKSDLPYIDNLNQKEKDLLLASLIGVVKETQLKLKNKKPKHKLVSDDYWKMDYKRRPPTMKEFIEDPFWLGNICSPNDPDSPDSVGLFPFLKAKLIAEFDYESKIHNAVITGSLGSGKSYVAVIIMLYKICLATLLKNPQTFFGLNPGTGIVYAIISVTLGQVKKTAFGDAIRFMGASPYFRDECDFDPDKKYSSGEIRFPSNIVLIAGSNSNHIIGQNVLGVFLDEGNFQTGPAPEEKAYALFTEARNRIKNRFMKGNKIFPAITIIASSAKDETSFTENVIKEINAVNNPRLEVVWRHAIYKVKPETLGLGNIWFKVAYGLKTQEPFILKGFYDSKGNPITGEYAVTGEKLSESDEHEEKPKGSAEELVPLMYLDDFKRNPRRGLQDFSGVAIGGSNRFLTSIVDLERCTELAEADGVTSPVIKGIHRLEISMEDPTKQIWDFLDHNVFITRIQSQFAPKRHPYAKRFAHVDLATSTLGGISICHHTGGTQKITTSAGMGILQPFSEYRMVIEYDFILTIAAGRIRKIDISKVRNFFIWLRNMCHYDFGKITFDQYQSEDSLQELEKAGFNVGRLSVDSPKDAYISMRQGIEELRIRPYRHDLLWHELENLIDTGKKIDHPAKGTKDVSDSFTGAYYNAITSDLVVSTEANTNPGLIQHRTLNKGVNLSAPPISINLPDGYSGIKSFEG